VHTDAISQKSLACNADSLLLEKTRVHLHEFSFSTCFYPRGPLKTRAVVDLPLNGSSVWMITTSRTRLPLYSPSMLFFFPEEVRFAVISPRAFSLFVLFSVKEVF